MNNVWVRRIARWRLAIALCAGFVIGAVVIAEASASFQEVCATVFGAGFMPHGTCYLWQTPLVGLHVGADALIALSYFSIPCGLLLYVRRRPEARFGRLFILFGAFISLCGLTHAVEVWNVWFASYWAAGWLKVVTGVVSATTAVVLLRSLPVAIRIPLPEEMRRVTSELQRESSARVQVEQRLQQRDADFEAILKGGLDAFYLTRALRDGSGRLIDLVFADVNDRAARQVGCDRSELVGKRATHFFPAIIDLGLLRKYESALATGEPYEEELLVERPDGQSRWYYYQCVPHGDSIALFTREITQRKTAEIELEQTRKALERRVAEQTQELWKSESCYKLLSEFIYSALWHTDENGRVMQPMPSWREFTGQAEEDCLGDGWVAMYAEEDRETILAHWRRSVAASDRFEIESRLWSAKRNAYIPVLSKGLAIKTRDGEVAEWIGAIYDLSDQKRQEEMLSTYARRVAAKNKALEEFTYIASHDMHEMLRKVRVYGEMLEEDCGRLVGEEGLGYIKVMRNAADRMERLLDDLLIYSRASSQEMHVGPVDIDELTNGILADFELWIEELGAVVEKSELPSTRCDPALLRLVLQNLISNALKYHKPGEPPRVSITHRSCLQREIAEFAGDELHLADEYIAITVKDEGIGFDPRFVDRIFKPFYRLHAPTEFSGSGIGLAICRQATERIGGFITVDTKDGGGAAFTVYLPAV